MTDIKKPLAYRPREYDDWGMIRCADGTLFARAYPAGPLSVADADAHRDAGTDPYEAVGRLIVKAVNERDELIAALRGMVIANPAFRHNRIGAPGSGARANQDNKITAEDRALAALARAESSDAQ